MDFVLDKCTLLPGGNASAVFLALHNVAYKIVLQESVCSRATVDGRLGKAVKELYRCCMYAVVLKIRCLSWQNFQ